MESRSRLCAALLIGCVLIAVAIAGAGCTGEKEPLAGMWVCHYGNDELTDVYLIINDDGSVAFVASYADGFVGMTDGKFWNKTGARSYQIPGPGFTSAGSNMTCSVSLDGAKLSVAWGVNATGTAEFSRYNATLPALTPETADLYKLHQIRGYWVPVNASDSVTRLNLMESVSYGKLGNLIMNGTDGNTTYIDVRWEYDKTVGDRNYFLLETDDGRDIATIIHHDDSNQCELYLGNATRPILLTKP